MRWPQSKWKQACISFGAAILCALLVFLQMAGECFNHFYFPRDLSDRHLGYCSGPEPWCIVGLTAVGGFVISALLQRAATRNQRPYPDREG
jgi:hypothetical protein